MAGKPVARQNVIQRPREEEGGIRRRRRRRRTGPGGARCFLPPRTCASLFDCPRQKTFAIPYNRYCSRFLNVENRVARMGSKVDSDRTVADERNANKRAPIYIYIGNLFLFFFYHGRIFVSVDPIYKRERERCYDQIPFSRISFNLNVYLYHRDRSFRYSFFTYR